MYAGMGIVVLTIVVVTVVLAYVLTQRAKQPTAFITTTPTRPMWEGSVPWTDGATTTNILALPGISWTPGTPSGSAWDAVASVSEGRIMADPGALPVSWETVRGVRLYIHPAVLLPTSASSSSSSSLDTQHDVDRQVVERLQAVWGTEYALVNPTAANPDDNVGVRGAWLTPGVVSTLMTSATYDPTSNTLRLSTRGSQTMLTTPSGRSLAVSLNAVLDPARGTFMVDPSSTVRIDGGDELALSTMQNGVRYVLTSVPPDAETQGDWSTMEHDS
jgi:hypothetical protein